MKRRLLLISMGFIGAGASAWAQAQASAVTPGPAFQSEPPGGILSGNVEPRPEQYPSRLESPRRGRTEALTSCTDPNGETWFRGQAGYPSCREAAHHKMELSGRAANPANISSSNGRMSDRDDHPARSFSEDHESDSGNP